MENTIAIEVFGLFSAKANGPLAILALVVILLGFVVFRVGHKRRSAWSYIRQAARHSQRWIAALWQRSAQ